MLPCFPPARLTLEQAEAELSFFFHPFPMARMSTGLGKKLRDSQLRNVLQLPGDIKSAQVHEHAQPSSFTGKVNLKCARGQDPPAGNIQVRMRPQKGESISDHGPQCLVSI